MASHPSFLACRRCNTVQWFTQECLDHYGKSATRCRKCRANDWRPANVYPTMAERLYLLRWFIWQNWYVNRKGVKDGDPHWYWKPWLVWKVLVYGLTIMRHYNRIEPEGDNECPRNIKALRAELSGNGADPNRSVPHADGVLRGVGGNPV